MMKQKLFSWGDDFNIKNEAGEPVFFVDGRAFSIGEKLSFQDMQKNELAFIRQKLLSWGPTYEITRNGVLAAVVKKHLFTLFRCKFTVDVPGPDDLEAQGSFLDMEYTFNRAGETVAEVSKRWFSFTDTYGVDIREGEDDVLILASTVVIDMVCHSDRKRDKPVHWSSAETAHENPSANLACSGHTPGGVSPDISGRFLGESSDELGCPAVP